MSALPRMPFEMSDDDYGVPFQMPGRSNGFFDLDADVGLGYPTRRADNIKVQTILGNAGDLDLAKTDGPTGWGLYTLDDAIRSYQERNDLKIDGWLRPGGPTIAKMRDQFGATLGKYPAPSPREVDAHHDRLAQGEPGLLNGTYGDLKLAPIPGLPAPDDDMVGSNRSMAEYLQRHRSGLADAPDTLASYIRTMGVPGIVQARDFVGQWDQTKPGQGGDAIRAILSALGDAPDLQRQFFGGPIANDRPIGIRMEDILMPSTVPRERGEGPRIRDYRLDRDGIVTPVTRPAVDGAMGEIRLRTSDSPSAPLPPLSHDGLLDPEYIKAFSERLEAKRAFEEQQRANTVYDDGLPDANNWPPHLRARLLGDTQASDETNQNFSGADEFEPAVPQTTDEDDAEPAQIAQASGERPSISPEFRNEIATRESRGQLDAIRYNGKGENRKEVLGQYQLTRNALVDAGLKNPDGSWKPDNPAGVKSDADFLKSRAAQDKAFDLVMRRNEQQIAANGSDTNVGQKIEGLAATFPITETGLAAAAHRAGPGAVNEYVRRMERNDWNSQKGLNEIQRTGRNPDEIRTKSEMHKAIETRLREFGNVRYR